MDNVEIPMTEKFALLTDEIADKTKYSARELLSKYEGQERFQAYVETYLKRREETIKKVNDRVSELRETYLAGASNDLNNLSEEEKNSLIDDIIFRQVVAEHMTQTIEAVKKEYGDIIPPEKLDLFVNLNNPENIVLDRKCGGDIKADSSIGKIVINPNNITGNTLEEKIVSSIGSSTHESFHLLITLLKPEELSEQLGERMFYIVSTSEGDKEVHFSSGKYGQALSEGFVEKMSSEFADRNGIFYSLNSSYIPYVDFCTELQNSNEQINPEFLFTHTGEDIISMMSSELQSKYEESERLAMINHFRVKEVKGNPALRYLRSDNVKESWMERQDVIVSRATNSSFSKELDVSVNEAHVQKSEAHVQKTEEHKEEHEPEFSTFKKNSEDRRNNHNNITHIKQEKYENYGRMTRVAEENNYAREKENVKVKKLEGPNYNTSGFTNIFILSLIASFIAGVLFMVIYFISN